MFLLCLPGSEKTQGGTCRHSDGFKEADMTENGWLFFLFLWDTYISFAFWKAPYRSNIHAIENWRLCHNLGVFWVEIRLRSPPKKARKF